MKSVVRRADGTIGVPSGKRSPLFDRDGFEVCLWYLSEKRMTWYFYGSGRVTGHVLALPITLKLRWVVEDDCIYFDRSPGQWEDLGMALRKIVAPIVGPTTGDLQTADCGTYPTLLEYLTATKYPDGTDREKSCLIIVAEATQWKGCLSDKDNDRSLWKAGDTVEYLLLALEEAAAQDEGWRINYEARKGRSKRK